MFLFRSRKLTDAEREFVSMPICGCSACEAKKRDLRKSIGKHRLEFLEILRHEYQHHDNNWL